MQPPCVIPLTPIWKLFQLWCVVDAGLVPVVLHAKILYSPVRILTQVLGCTDERGTWCVTASADQNATDNLHAFVAYNMCFVIVVACCSLRTILKVTLVTGCSKHSLVGYFHVDVVLYICTTVWYTKTLLVLKHSRFEMFCIGNLIIHRVHRPSCDAW